MKIFNQIKFNGDGLIPAIAQDFQSKQVLMMAWMNKESLQQTITRGFAVYWSRSRQKLWAKGEESGNTQKVVQIRLDCDNDVLLLLVEQIGGIACHTGRKSCFFKKLSNDCWQIDQPVLKDPKEMYKNE